jgi:hypothetical protein
MPAQRFTSPPEPRPEAGSLPVAFALVDEGRTALLLTLSFAGDLLLNAVRVWDTRAGTCTLTQLPPGLRAFAVRPGAGTLAAFRDDERGRTLLEVDAHTGAVLGTLWSEAGTVSPTGDACVWSAPSGLVLSDRTGERWTQPDRAFTRWTGVAWATPELLVVASQYPKKTLSLVSARDGAILARHPTVTISEGFLLAPGGRRLLSDARLVDVTTGEALKRPLLKKDVSASAFSPDGTVLAVADERGRVVVLGDDATRTLAAFDSGMASPQLAWLPDGSRLAIADGTTGSLGLWDASEVAPGVAIASSPATTVADAYALPTPAAPPAPLPPRQEVEVRGSIHLERSRPPPALDQHLAEIEAVLGRPLPEDVAAFYARNDGVGYRALQQGASLGLDETLLGLEQMFDGFRPHRQFRSAAAYEKARDELSELPLWGDTWSEDFEVEDRERLRHLNALMRSKQLVRIAGQSDAIVIDFAPPAPKGGTAPAYQVALAHRGHEHHPLELSFPEFVRLFETFGVAGWHLAYLSPASLEATNLDPVPTVEAGLAPFAADFPAEVEALVARARRQRDLPRAL